MIGVVCRWMYYYIQVGDLYLRRTPDVDIHKFRRDLNT